MPSFLMLMAEMLAWEVLEYPAGMRAVFFFWLLASVTTRTAHAPLRHGSGYSAEPMGMRLLLIIHRLLWGVCMRLNLGLKGMLKGGGGASCSL